MTRRCEESLEALKEASKKARLVLEDGTIFEGYALGCLGSTSGEVVFNTGMVGYPETLTDPSYQGQILVFTYPLIGNYGVPSSQHTLDNLPSYFESERIQVKGVVMSDYCHKPSHWNCSKTLHEWLVENKIPGLYGIDTRALTKKLREKGTMLGKIVAEGADAVIDTNTIPFYNPDMENQAAEASIKEPKVYKRGEKTIMLVDCGVKNSIIKEFLKRDATVIRVPWNYDINSSAYKYDGLFLSNGPGNPKHCTAAIENVRKAMERNVPIFGICLGSQILALAAGADTYKLKFGHRSQNQPCLKLGTKKCYITSQNHGFAVDAKTLPEGWEEMFINNNDETNEGIRHRSRPFFSVQFHPEAMPGPEDTSWLFDQFLELIGNHQGCERQ